MKLARPTIEERIDFGAALREFQIAVREALIDHARFGNPVAIGRSGRTEIVQPEDIPALLGLSMDEVFGPPSRRRPADAAKG